MFPGQPHLHTIFYFVHCNRSIVSELKFISVLVQLIATFVIIMNYVPRNYYLLSAIMQYPQIFIPKEHFNPDDFFYFRPGRKLDRCNEILN